MSGPSLHRKLAEVYAIVERIPKRGKAPAEMGGYPFVQVGDAADPIRKALGERHLTMLPAAIEVVGQSEHEDSRQRIVTTCDVRVTWTIADGESGETASLQSMGSGQDRGDKYVPKALTNAMKYAILLGFLLPTGDDPEGDKADDRTPRRAAPRSVPSSPAGAPDADVWEGRVDKGRAPVDQSLRQTPDGPLFGFVLLEDIPGGRNPRKTQVVCEGALASAASVAFASGAPASAMVWGTVEMVAWDKKDENGELKKMPPFRRVHATRIKTADWTAPVDEPTDDEIAAPGGSGAGTDELDSLPW